MGLSFHERLAAVMGFFSPENQQKLEITCDPSIALLVIDVQKEFCDPKGDRGNAETAEVSQRIKSLVPEFRKAGVPVYAIYFSRDGQKKLAEIDFYEFTPSKEDTLVAKDMDSAFAGSNINTILKKHKRKTLLACGFNLNACVDATVTDAVHQGFKVEVLRDLTGNDNRNDGDRSNIYLGKMEEQGIAIRKSQEVLARLQAQQRNLRV